MSWCTVHVPWTMHRALVFKKKKKKKKQTNKQTWGLKRESTPTLNPPFFFEKIIPHLFWWKMVLGKCVRSFWKTVVNYWFVFLFGCNFYLIIKKSFTCVIIDPTYLTLQNSCCGAPLGALGLSISCYNIFAKHTTRIRRLLNS